MKNTLKLMILMLTLALLLLPVSAVYARGASGGLLDGRVIFGDNFTLESGDTLTGDLVVFGGNVTVEEDSTIQGDTVVIGGNVTLNGNVEGSLVSIGGSTRMGETSFVEGDLVTIGGSLSRDPGSEVGGDVVTNVPAPDIRIPDIQVPDVPNPPSPPNPPNINFDFNPIGNFFRMFGTAIAVSLLAMLASLFLQPQIERVSQAIVGNVVISGSIGLLTIIAAVISTAILAVTIILIPVAALVVLAVPLAWLFGMISIGNEVGERFTRTINQTWAPPLTAGMGTFLMMIVVGGVGMIPCLGWFTTAVIALIGVGAVVLTIFGTQSYPRVVAPVITPGNDPVG
jgi:hypothetical protein